MFPTLFHKSSTGKIRRWDIRVDDDAIVTSYGYIDGKITQVVKKITCGKNLGKTNETSIHTQAISEAASKWDKKILEGYTQSFDDLEHIKPIKPMLALDFTKRGSDISFPCYTQPKVDGCRAILNNGIFNSRNGKLFYNTHYLQPHPDSKLNNYIIDGEIYSEELDFQELTGLIKRYQRDDNTNTNNIKLLYIVYDIIIPDMSFSERFELLQQLFSEGDILNPRIQLLQTDVCKTKQDILTNHDLYTSRGYEGAMIRNKHGLYKHGYRSKDLQKYKHFIDNEYPIVGFSEGDGTEKGCVVWRCKDLDTKLEFNVRPKGTQAERRELFKCGDNYIGKMCTIRYQNLTVSGLPRFPVGICIRDYE